MAEIVGVVSAGTGIVSFLFQVGIGIKTIRRAISYNRHQAPVDLEAVAADLEILQSVLNDMKDFQYNVLVALAIESCRRMFTEIETELGKLSQVFGHNKSRKSRIKSLKTQLTLKAEDNVKNIRKKVQEIMEKLFLASIRLNQVEPSQAGRIGLVPYVTAGTITTMEHTQTRDDSVAQPPCPRNRPTVRRRRLDTRIGEACSHNQLSYVSRRFWWLEFTPSMGLRHKCSTCSSTRCEWSAKLRLALTWINISYAVTVGFTFVRDSGQYDLKPALAIQHVVKNISPGFEALFLCRHCFISVEETKQRLRDVYRSSPGHFKRHVNPAGKGYLRHLISSPWQVQKNQFELLDFFLSELGMDFAAEDPKLLTDCSNWIGEGWHLDLLEIILHHGFEPISVDPPATKQWPEPCNPNWRWESITPDPFFIDYFALIVRHEPGFAGVTEMQALILDKSAHSSLEQGLPNQREPLSTVNFLGQSSLHLAVGNIQTVTMLLDLGHDLDSTDRWGITPLMYAAGMGFEEVAVHLLLKGANPGLRDHRFNRTFLDYAIIRGHWNLIHKTLSALQDICPHKVYQVFVKLVVFRAMTSSLFDVTEETRRQHVSKLIRLCDDVNFRFNDSSQSVTDNNLMHYAETVEEAEALVCRGFNGFNQPNSDGRLVMHSKMHNKALLNFCVDHGTDINHVDVTGRTLLLILLSSLQDCGTRKSVTLQQIQCCLERGADHRYSDDCKCSCSPHGCSSSAAFGFNFDREWSLYAHNPNANLLCAFEWQSILRKVHGEDAVKGFLLSFIRRIKFDELGMTHVCCHRGLGFPSESRFETYPKAMGEEDIVDILEEESDFINILDQGMRDLALKPVKDLQKHLLEIFKGKNDEYLKQIAKERTEDSKRTGEAPEEFFSWKADHKKDELVQQIRLSSNYRLLEYCMTRSLAAYILYLDLEYFNKNEFVSEISGQDLLYSRRMNLVKEIIEVFGLSTADMTTSINDAITRAGLSLDKHTEKQIKDRCIAFLKAVGSHGRVESLASDSPHAL